LSDRLRPLLAILVLGAFSQVAQAVLIREGLVVFYGNEISLGAFYGSWLFWLGLGSLAALRLDPAGGSGAAAVRAILLALPPVLGLQVLHCARCGWPWTSPPASSSPSGTCFWRWAW
jgi:spermidine synthase